MQRILRKRTGLIDFASNDYLGLARSENFAGKVRELWELWQKRIEAKVGSTGSRLLTGNHLLFEELEERIAEFHGFTAGLLFNCGYMANLSLLSVLQGAEIVLDSECHASFHDAIKLGGSKKWLFRHNDLCHLEERLKNRRGPCYVAIESIYSMSGDRAPLPQIAALCSEYGAKLIVDEAHAVGLYGPEGRGLVAEYRLQNAVFALVVPFGKALGAHGAILLGPSSLKKRCIQSARPFLYTTAIPLPLLAAIATSYDLFPFMEQERKHHHLLHSTPIEPIFIPGCVITASHFLAHQGFDLRPIHPPTVPRGKERLRLCIHAHNTQEELSYLRTLIARWRFVCGR